MQAFYKIARLGHNKPLIWQAKKITNMSDTNSDIHISGLFAKLPKGCHPYISLMRLDRPIGWWLLLLPGWWTILLSAENLGVALWLMALFLIGAIAMRAVPMGRMSEPEDIAGMVSWLLSADARGVTGQSLDMNGGAWM